jgi:hypothetical protein
MVQGKHSRTRTVRDRQITNKLQLAKFETLPERVRNFKQNQFGHLELVFGICLDFGICILEFHKTRTRLNSDASD